MHCHLYYSTVYETAAPVTLLFIISVLFLQLQYRLYPAVPVTL